MGEGKHYSHCTFYCLIYTDHYLGNACFLCRFLHSLVFIDLWASAREFECQHGTRGAGTSSNHSSTSGEGCQRGPALMVPGRMQEKALLVLTSP